MPRVSINLHGSLADFTHAERGVRLDVEPHRTLKDVLEALGVPHVEIARIRVNGQNAGLEARPSDGDEISVFDHQPGEEPLPARFLLDGHLGALARRLRLLGFDAEWTADEEDATLARRSGEEDRVLLTRDVGLLKRRLVRRGYWVRSTDPEEQLSEVMRRYALGPRAHPFSRCLRCNGELVDVPKSAVVDRVPPYVAKTQERFRECSRCGGVFWQGTHHARLKARCDSVLK